MAIGDEILARARAHWESVKAELEYVEVPEWGDGENPQRIYYRKANLAEIARVQKQLAKGLIEGAIEMLIVRALDEAGAPLFKPAHRTELERFVCADVALRVVNAMHIDTPDIEEVEKN